MRQADSKEGKYLIYTIIFIIGIFCVLYYRFIFGTDAYMYSDIGSDTISLLYPWHIFRRGLIDAGAQVGYYLQNGLGAEVTNLLSVYLNPFDWVFLVVSSNKLYYAIIISNFIKEIWIGIFSYLYFKRFIGSKAACISSTIFAFSSYIVLWGQQPDFATAVAYFIATIYFLQCYLDNKKQFIFIIPILSLLALNYYFLYMVGLFCIGYVIFYDICINNNYKNIIKHLLALAIMAIVACIVVLPELITSLRVFFDSSRTNDVSSQTNMIFGLYSADYLVSFIGRFFSNNVLGIGNEYSGAYNYYEVAMISTSVLSGYSLVYLMQTKLKKKAILIFVISIISLLFPIVTYIMNFNMLKQRWSFIICFISVVSIALFIDDIIEDIEVVRPRLLKTLVITDVIYLLMLIILVISHYKGAVDLHKRSCILVCGVLVIYNAFLFILYAQISINRFIVLSILVIAEMIVLNYDTINSRNIVSNYYLNNGLYNDGTSDAIESLKDADDSIYRVNKSYYSVGYMDSLAQNYNGMSTYNAVNSKEFVQFIKECNIEFLNGKTKITSIPWDRYYLNTLLGCKYLLTKNPIDNSTGWNLVSNVNNIYVYKNNCDIGFGYVYTNEYEKSEVLSLPIEEQDVARLSGFYYTDGMAVNSQHINIIQPNDALESLQQSKLQDVTYSDNVLTGTLMNDSLQGGMLCVPLIYSDSWKASVDGQMVDTYNINGGLLGINVDAGRHTVRIEYENLLSSATWMKCLRIVIILSASIYWGIFYVIKDNSAKSINEIIRYIPKFLKKRIIILIVVALSIVMIICALMGRKRYYVTQYGDEDRSQVMFYTITDNRGGLIIIDGGTSDYEDDVRQVIKKNGNKVDAWIITHPHPDHVGAFNKIYGDLRGITIRKIYTGNIDRAVYEKVDREPDDRIDYYYKFLELAEADDSIQYVNVGDSIEINGLRFDFLWSYNEAFELFDFVYDLPNSVGLVFKVTNKNESMLFWSDLGEDMLNYIDCSDISADYVEAAHHGQNLNDEIYEKVGAHVAFVDAPKWLREGEQYTTKYRIEWFRRNNVKVKTFCTAPNTIELK